MSRLELATKTLRHEEQIRKIEKWENRRMGELFYYFAIYLFDLDSKNLCLVTIYFIKYLFANIISSRDVSIPIILFYL